MKYCLATKYFWRNQYFDLMIIPCLASYVMCMPCTNVFNIIGWDEEVVKRVRNQAMYWLVMYTQPASLRCLSYIYLYKTPEQCILCFIYHSKLNALPSITSTLN